MRKLYVAAHLPDAQLLRHVLEAEGIPSRVFNQNLQGAIGELPHVYPEVWIEDEGDWSRAHTLVHEFEARVIPTEGIVRCSRCGEDNPSNFELCWQCGSPMTSSLNHGSEKKEEN